jgi:hypothetical protein
VKKTLDVPKNLRTIGGVRVSESLKTALSKDKLTKSAKAELATAYAEACMKGKREEFFTWTASHTDKVASQLEALAAGGRLSPEFQNAIGTHAVRVLKDTKADWFKFNLNGIMAYAGAATIVGGGPVKVVRSCGSPSKTPAIPKSASTMPSL